MKIMTITATRRNMIHKITRLCRWDFSAFTSSLTPWSTEVATCKIKAQHKNARDLSLLLIGLPKFVLQVTLMQYNVQELAKSVMLCRKWCKGLCVTLGRKKSYLRMWVTALIAASFPTSHARIKALCAIAKVCFARRPSAPSFASWADHILSKAVGKE